MKIKVQMTDGDFEPLERLMTKHTIPADHPSIRTGIDLIKAEIESIANRAFEAGRALGKLEGDKLL
jgi:hypothetical protein